MFIDLGLIEKLNRNGFDIGKNWSLLKKTKIWFEFELLERLKYVLLLEIKF